MIGESPLLRPLRSHLKRTRSEGSPPPNEEKRIKNKEKLPVPGSLRRFHSLSFLQEEEKIKALDNFSFTYSKLKLSRAKINLIKDDLSLQVHDKPELYSLASALCQLPCELRQKIISYLDPCPPFLFEILPYIIYNVENRNIIYNAKNRNIVSDTALIELCSSIQASHTEDGVGEFLKSLDKLLADKDSPENQQKANGIIDVLLRRALSKDFFVSLVISHYPSDALKTKISSMGIDLDHEEIKKRPKKEQAAIYLERYCTRGEARSYESLCQLIAEGDLDFQISIGDLIIRAMGWPGTERSLWDDSLLYPSLLNFPIT